MVNVDLLAEIIPGKSAAGFELGMNIDSIGDVTSKAKRWIRSNGQLGKVILNEPDWLFVEHNELEGDSKVGSYYFGYGAVELNFDSDGFLEWIAVSIGYKGKFMAHIGIGDKLKEVTNYFELIYDNVEELHFPVDESGVVGIMFQADEISLNELPEQEINRIIIDNPYL